MSKVLNRGKKVVFTNGCFDVLHVGHVALLRYCRRLNGGKTIVVVGVNDDDSVRRLKGDSRPINKKWDRIIVLEELESVDCVYSFSEDTPINLIKKISPDYLVKGGDYLEHQIVGAEYVRSYGGKVLIFPTIEGLSSTRIIEASKLRP